MNQPFHVCGFMPQTDFLPLQSIALRNEQFHAPQNLDMWLTLNYDKNWKTPQPGFVLDTPLTTQRRFGSWFGYSFQQHYDYWSSRYNHQLPTHLSTLLTYKEGLPRPSFNANIIVNAGCGARIPLPANIEITASRATIIGVDYVAKALELAKERSRAEGESHQLRTALVNLSDYYHVLKFVRTEISQQPFDVYVGFLAEGMGKHQRWTLWRLMSLSLRTGGTVILDTLIEPAASISAGDPLTWHLEEEWIFDEADRHGLGCTNLSSGTILVEHQMRSYARYEIHAIQSMKHSIEQT